MQRDLTLMLMREHELRAMEDAARGVIRVSREMSDENALARAHQLLEDVKHELTMRREDSEAPF